MRRWLVRLNPAHKGGFDILCRISVRPHKNSTPYGVELDGQTIILAAGNPAEIVYEALALR